MQVILVRFIAFALVTRLAEHLGLGQGTTTSWGLAFRIQEADGDVAVVVHDEAQRRRGRMMMLMRKDSRVM